MQNERWDGPRVREIVEEDSREARIVRTGLAEGWDVAEFAVMLGVRRPEVETIVRRHTRQERPMPMG